jgi:NAD(P)-dependent dehydrogenase (short-subunit alcohol dehydrogenase family)
MFENRIAVVTGGTGALGKTVVDLFAEKGMKVYVPTLTVDKCKEVFDNSQTAASSSEFKLRKIFCLQCDASNEEDVKNFISDVLKREGKIDYLVNTVGGYHTKKNIADMDSELVDKMLTLNFKTAFFFSKHVLKSMIEKNFGRIIAIGAMPAVEITAGKFAYSVSKSNVVNLIQTVAEETKENDITANAIIPSTIDTPANRESMKNADFGKWVKPEDIAKTILFMLSDSARSFRGNIIKMYGGV